MWALAAGGTGADGGLVIVDLAATLVTSHSEEENAAPAWKNAFGVPPLAAFADHGRDGTGGRWQSCSARKVNRRAPRPVLWSLLSARG